MSNRVYNHLEFQPKNSDVRFSGNGRGSENMPERASDYYEQKRSELEAIKKDLKQNNKPLNTIKILNVNI